MMDLLAKRSADSSAGFNNYNVEHFNGHPYQLFELNYTHGNYRIGLELDYWVEPFSQNSISFYTQRHKDPNAPDFLNCDILASDSFNPLDGAITGCVNASEAFSFLPLTLNFSYLLYNDERFSWDLGIGLGYLFGKANIVVTTEYYAGRINGDEINFDLNIGNNIVGKVFSSFEYQPSSYFGIQFRLGYRYSQISQLKVDNVKGSSEIFQLVMGKPIVSGQQLYIESFPGLDDSENELSLLVQSEQFKDANFYNSIQGDLNGLILSLRFTLNFEI